MGLWDDFRAGATKVAGAVGGKIGEVADHAGTEFNILKIKRAIGLLEGECHELEQKMGRRVFDLFRAGKIDDPELTAVCGEVDGLRKRVIENEEEIERIRRLADEERARARERAAQDEPPPADPAAGPSSGGPSSGGGPKAAA